ncbi:hypothetical protein Sru01_13080 [Sphaerisporangium rufum]|uniref:histidine kinase n=1 Tax=Sphaerisporangium rufum TaxID=1381558 RepID=A0A919QY96_9ACTN|nr:nitrate- and nitrite sensing domain-containing protein [Sphaerisporangium rufum]GII76326.1 hypothetical protein Sru01_13080 [Sphaerisporangium rufum]
MATDQASDPAGAAPGPAGDARALWNRLPARPGAGQAPAGRTLRFKLYSLLGLLIVALIALWTFMTGNIVGELFELRRATTLAEQVAAPAADLAGHVQEERRLSAVLVATGSAAEGTTLSGARERTDAAVRLFHQRATSLEGLSATGPEVVASREALETALGRLDAVREEVDARATTRMRVIQDYSAVQDALFRMYDDLVTVPDIDLYRRAAGLQRVVRARELLSREEAVMAAAAGQRAVTSEEQRLMAQTVAGRRLLLGSGLQALDAELRAPFDDLMESTDYQRLTAMENQVIAGSGPVEDARGWPTLVRSLGGRVDRLVADRAAEIGERTEGAAGAIIAQIVIAGGLGLVAILLAVVLSVRLGRRLAEDLAGLRSAALDLADVRLPRVVARLRASEDVDVESEAPPIPVTSTTLEVKDVAQAFSTVRRTAIEAAVGQAELRKGINLVFRNLARRNQSLLHRQLTQLDAMQRKTGAPDALEDLFRLDHLTTRMRRQAEGLIILSGAPAGRAWRKPVPVHDVVRGAVAEVEDFTRVTVLPMTGASLLGTAVADVIHLLAELIENATVFSPPSTRVNVRGEQVGRGFVIEVEDRGLGMSAEDREDLNRRLANPPEFDLTDSDRLGLFVVSRLATRHGISVSLRRSPYGGITAVVLLPHGLVAPGPDEPAAPPSPARSDPRPADPARRP